MKIGRNDPCWCGSGIKYKKCHLNRENQKAINQRVIHKQLSSFYDKKYCSIPKSMKHECSKRIVKAHSVSKKSSLKDISKNGHVLTTFKTISKDKITSKIVPKQIGINIASTFTGFCSKHDKELFSPIEDKPFEITPYNCFLVAYRALARELFVKKSSSGTFDLIKDLDKGFSLVNQLSIQNAHQYFSKNNDLTTNDLKYMKSIYDLCLENNDFIPINHMIFQLNSIPKVMTSAIVAPPFDFQGQAVQELTTDPKDIPDYLAINVFSSNNVGYIVISWLEEHEKIRSRFCESLLKTKCPADNLLCFIFSAIENIYISEDWWNKLNLKYKDNLLDIFSQGVNKPTNNDVLMTSKSFEAFDMSKRIEI